MYRGRGLPDHRPDGWPLLLTTLASLAVALIAGAAGVAGLCLGLGFDGIIHLCEDALEEAFRFRVWRSITWFCFAGRFFLFAHGKSVIDWLQRSATRCSGQVDLGVAFTLWSLVPHGGLNCSDKKNISHVRSIRKKGWSIGYTKPSLASGNNSLVSVSVIDFKWKGAANDSRIYA